MLSDTGQTVGRYAPSPTGRLHLGNLRTALLAWLQARLASGRFILRMEDLDTPRVRPQSAAEILRDLHWLGLDWDEGPDCGGPHAPYNQAHRTEIYRYQLDRLRETGRTFPCFCSRKDVLLASSAPHGPDGPLYPGTCRGNLGLNLDPSNHRGERHPSWRFLTDERAWSFADQLLGPQSQNLASDVGDFVIRRADDLFAYQLAVVVDDALMGVTDVVRGADLLASTPRQIALFDALGFSAPTYWHVPLMCDATGARLAKRDGSFSVAELRAQGLSASHVVGHLAQSVGLIDDSEALTCRDLLDGLSLPEFTARLKRCTERGIQ